MSQRIKGWTGPEWNGVSHWLIRQAARHAPEILSARLEEEWLADAQSRVSSLSTLRFALGCCWATVVIVDDCRRHAVPEAMPAAVAGGFGTFTEGNFAYVSLRSGTLFLIVGMYAALFCGLTPTLSQMRGAAPSAHYQDRGNSQYRESDTERVEITSFLPAK